MHALFENVAVQVTHKLEGIDARITQRHPQQRQYLWDVQQVIEHLGLSYSSTARALEGTLSKGRGACKVKRTCLQWILQLMVLSFGYLPRGVPAMDDTDPALVVEEGKRPMDGDELVALLRRRLTAMDQLLDFCREKYGMERVAVHPILGPLRVDQWRRFHSVHTLHHLRQIQRVLAQVDPQPAEAPAFGVKLAKELHIPAQRSLT